MNRLTLLALCLLSFAACREVYPVKDLHPSSVPDISRLILKNGQVVKFNADFGWYNRNVGTIEGMTDSNKHVEFRLLEVNRVETVRGYSIIPAVIVGGMILGAGIWLVEKLLTIL